MTNLAELNVWTLTDGDKCAAATGRSPYFCFIADTEEAALAKAAAALRFYEGALLREAEQVRQTGQERKPFKVGRSIPAKELAVA